MALDFVLVGDWLNDAIDGQYGPYIDKYKKCLDALVPSKMISYDHACFTTYTDMNNGHYLVIPKTSSLLRFYQRSMPGTNVLVYFVNMNEQKNYPFQQLQKWKTSLSKRTAADPTSNPHHPDHPQKSYQFFQRMMIGISHFIYPPKYLCIVLCGAHNLTHFNQRKV